MWGIASTHSGLSWAPMLTQVVQEYDAVSPLDDWMTTILLRIKKSLNSDELT